MADMKLSSSCDLKSEKMQPRIIIHGGAGNITRANLPANAEAKYRTSLRRILASSHELLQKSDITAVDVAVHAVAEFEKDPLFNAGHGAVFTRAGTVELEASLMVSRGRRKRCVGLVGLKHVKHPIRVAREMLLRDDEEDGGGAYAHCMLSGAPLEELARSWGLEMCDERYHWTRRRWEEHRRGLRKKLSSATDEKLEDELKAQSQDEEEWQARMASYGVAATTDDPSWDGHEYLPQGTVGAVVLDSTGTICVATSTGGLTNKLPGRVGDTPTPGAGFWAEEWRRPLGHIDSDVHNQLNIRDLLSRGDLLSVLGTCLPFFPPSDEDSTSTFSSSPDRDTYAVAMSGTGNGDSFLRTNAVRTTAALCRFSTPRLALAAAVHFVAGPGGELQRSAGNRWGQTGEGMGGIIGIQRAPLPGHQNSRGTITFAFNCGGLFRAWADIYGKFHVGIFPDEALAEDFE